MAEQDYERNKLVEALRKAERELKEYDTKKNIEEHKESKRKAEEEAKLFVGYTREEKVQKLEQVVNQLVTKIKGTINVSIGRKWIKIKVSNFFGSDINILIENGNVVHKNFQFSVIDDSINHVLRKINHYFHPLRTDNACICSICNINLKS